MDGLTAKIIVIAFLVESIVLHEVAHGFVALLFGDHTARRQGRITLNPVPHIDPVWTIAIPVVAFLVSNGSFVIGGARPVPVNPANYRRPILGDVCVSAAGIAVNFLIAVLMILLLNVVGLISGDLAGSFTAGIFLRVALLNIVLALFNLIPIPPLDGSHLFKYLLPGDMRGPFEKLGRSGAGFIILIVAINIPGVWNGFRTLLHWVGGFLLGNLIFF
ncbi:MAG: site-2 protease family protein [Desulfobacterales bacterium]